jgi:phage baseplate assembly protein W
MSTHSPLGFAWSVDGRGRTQDTDHWVRELIEQVLLTAPGERVMRPDFGAGLLAAVFEPGGPEVAATTQFLVQGALQRELAEVIAIEAVQVQAQDAALVVSVAYRVLADGSSGVAQVQAGGAL